MYSDEAVRYKIIEVIDEGKSITDLIKNKFIEDGDI
jgi:hypothetical protein